MNQMINKNNSPELENNPNTEENTTSKAKNYVMSTVFNTSLFVMMSFITKTIHLTFTVLIARIVSKESYGITTVYFNFIFTLLLHFPRDTLRKTCLKYCPDENEEQENKKFSEASHLIWLMNFATLVVSFPLALIFICFGGGGSESKGISEYKTHLFLYVLAAFIELAGEPAVIYLNIKIDKKYRLIGMTLTNYTKLITTYLFAIFFGMDLWAFTLSRMVASCLNLFYYVGVGIFIYKLDYSVFIPNFRGMLNVLKNTEIITTFNSFIKGISLKMVLNYAEKVALSFFLNAGEEAKAEYTFVVENFSTFIRFIIEPAEENFYNLINKIKHFKSLTVIPSTGEEFSGDFSKSENEILVKLYSNFKKKDKDKENYSFKLLKLSLKIFFVFGILLYSYLYLIGKELIIYIYTEKWGTEHTISILKVYASYVGVLAVTLVIEAYANAICSVGRMNVLTYIMVINACLSVFLSIFLSQYDITGLVWANILTLLLRFFVNLYLVISIELEDQINKTICGDVRKSVVKTQNEEDKFINNKEHVRKANYRTTPGMQQECLKSSQIVIEMFRFLVKSFMKTPAIVSTLTCLVILGVVKDLISFDENHFLLLFSSAIILGLNTLLIFLVEKKGFLEILRLKSSGLSV